MASTHHPVGAGESEKLPVQPSPLVGEGAAPAADEGCSGELSNLGAITPHPDASHPPSPTRGEGCVEFQDERLRGYAKAMRRRPTDAELTLWRMLRNRQFSQAKFRRQVPVGSYIADFLSYHFRLIVELDGPIHDSSTRDAKRDAELRGRGFRVLRFRNEDVFRAMGTVLDAISKAMGAAMKDGHAAQPSPLVGKGAAPASDEGCSREPYDPGTITPHPDASHPPSPTRGEGCVEFGRIVQ